jgi:hypothetical protein
LHKITLPFAALIWYTKEVGLRADLDLPTPLVM